MQTQQKCVERNLPILTSAISECQHHHPLLGELAAKIMGALTDGKDTMLDDVVRQKVIHARCGRPG